MDKQYYFTLEKISEYKKKKMPVVICKGFFDLSMIKQPESKEVEYLFRFKSFEQKGMKDPLILTPFKWIVSDEKKSNIKSKNNLESIWKRYRDKHNKPELQAYFLVLERLLFHSDLGFEYYSLSYSMYLPFFALEFANIKEDDIFDSLDWLFIPMDIPLKTHYKCLKNTETHIILEGWITLDKEKLDNLLLKEKFSKKAKEYHHTQNFSIESKIEIEIYKKDLSLIRSFLSIEIKGENDLYDKFEYTIGSDMAKKLGIDPEKYNPNAKYVVGKLQILD